MTNALKTLVIFKARKLIFDRQNILMQRVKHEELLYNNSLRSTYILIGDIYVIFP